VLQQRRIRTAWGTDQDLAIEGSLYSLERLSNMVPARFEPAHRSLLQDIKDYRAQYPDSNKGTGIEESR